ncbi:MAG: leucine--tRNA ligase [Candidatus Magasanikbacteria bacterium]|nr:leucine--tRNA ligase [Candidatus Magasanikbacteria bacterium]
MEKYNFSKIEKKWQEKWEENKTFEVKLDESKEKFYVLVEFPYPSGAGLHVGHPRSYTAMDIIARKKRMDGKNVLYPIGYDAFGLPTENYAIKTGRAPKEVTKENIANFRRQLKSLGFSFDWSREIDTTDPKYYKWTQWIFLQLFKNGLAYKKSMPINWCPSCKTGLANEEVVNGACERCGGEVEKRDKSQWMLAITKYADKLLDGLENVDYVERAKTQQRNWIGKSEGALVKFGIKQKGDFSASAQDDMLEVFTTRPDTLFGATYCVVSPEHSLVEELKGKIENFDEVLEYIKQAGLKSDLERVELQKEKTGVELKGIKAVNPANNEEIPVWVADYVLATYGTGAIMSVPAHDQRDWEFAGKYGLDMVEVISGGDILEGAFLGEGGVVNSDFLNELSSKESKEKMIAWLEEKGLGERKTNFKLRDWVFSRQRYWGEPIPLVYCESCAEKGDFQNEGEKQNPGWIMDENLPLELPEVEKYEPTDSGESPLASVEEWLKTTCPRCGGEAHRETDTMPNWAGSSWYSLRYVDNNNDTALASPEALKYWMPVDWYNGGMEHTTLHLLYSRFWNIFLYDIGVVPQSEPYQKRTSHGMILAENGEKMSKSRGNVVNPDEIVEKFGADALRLYIMFMGPFDQAVVWDTNGLKGVKRFLDKVVNLQEFVKKDVKQNKTLHKTIKKVGEDIEEMSFNTSVAKMMEFVNEITKVQEISKEDMENFLKILSPFAPHLAEELWEKLGNTESIAYELWPSYDENMIKDETVKVGIQINGKVRDDIEVPAEISEEEIKELVLQREKVQKWLEGNEPKKVIYVKGRLVSIVV